MEAVQKKLLDARSDASKGQPIIVGKVPNIKEFGEIWLEQIVKMTAKPRSYEFYRDLLRLHIVPTLGRTKLTKLTPAMVQKLMADKLASGLSPQTVNSIRGCLRALLSKALRQNLISRNVACSQYVDAPRIPHREVAVLDPAQARHFLDCAQGDPYEGIYMLAITCGLRKGECLGLQWSSIDWDGGTIRITQTLQKVRNHSEQGKKTVMIACETKSSCSRRTIALPEFLIKVLRTQRARQAEQRLAAGASWVDQTGLVFADAQGKSIDPSTLYDAYKALLERAELPDMPFHNLRHCAASLLLSQGTHPKLVQQLLGHSSINITMNVYSHLLEASRRETATTMSNLFKR